MPPDPAMPATPALPAVSGPQKRRILLALTDERARRRIAEGLRAAGYAVRAAASLDEARQLLGGGLTPNTDTDATDDESLEGPRPPCDLAVCEVDPVQPEDLDAIGALAQLGPTVVALVRSGRPDEASGAAAAVIAAGAYDALLGSPRSTWSATEIVVALGKAAARETRLGDRAAARFLPAQTPAPSSQPPLPLIAQAPRMRELLRQVHKVAAHPTSVLLLGESGTGKELVARALHALSPPPRRDGPFVAVNCGALPEALLESLLLGHRRGAFTDAVRDQRGVFEEASGGTLFLDEIGELPLGVQVKLLRVLQEHQVVPLGGDSQAPIPVDVRVVAATLRDLEAEVAAGRFRADLYYRLSVVPLQLPPLRERRTDIVPLARHFLARAREKLNLAAGGRVLAGLTPAAERALLGYGWPGNVRELENTIERAAVLCEHTLIDLADLPLAITDGRGARAKDPDQPPSLTGGVAGPRASAPAGDLEAAGTPHTFALGEDDLSIKQATARLERTLIRRALRRTRGNRTAAAKLLELSHRALLYKLREYGLDAGKRGDRSHPDPDAPDDEKASGS